MQNHAGSRLSEDEHLVAGRRARLVEEVARTGRVRTTAAADALGVSVDTVRRDLRWLHGNGMLRRVHGGAVPASTTPRSYAARMADTSPSRDHLADAVIARLTSGMVIGLDAGSTCARIAARLPRDLEVTIVTNNPAVPVALGDNRATTVILLGGVVDLTWMASTGASVVAGWAEHRLDLAVLGACGVDLRAGVTTRSAHEVATKRGLVAAAAETLLPLQVKKWGVQDPFVVVDLESLDVVVAEPDFDSDAIQALIQTGIEVVA